MSLLSSNGNLLTADGKLLAAQATAGSSWTDGYGNFATGTFTPEEDITDSYQVDTGIPWTSRNYRQVFIFFEEPTSQFVISNILCGAARITSSESYDVESFVGYYSGGGILGSRNVIKQPATGESVWTITCSTTRKFKAGKTYRWMLIEASDT